MLLQLTPIAPLPVARQPIALYASNGYNPRMKLFITRHGETDWNVKMLACGISEAELTGKGRAQAQALANRLKDEKEKNGIRAIYVSPLKRARETAAYIEKALNITAEPDSRLTEMNFGRLEGEKWSRPEFSDMGKNPFFKFPEGESLVQTAHRAYSIIEDVIKKHKNGGNILFVCHGVLTAALCTYFKSYSSEEFSKLDIANCQLLEFDL